MKRKTKEKETNKFTFVATLIRIHAQDLSHHCKLNRVSSSLSSSFSINNNYDVMYSHWTAGQSAYNLRCRGCHDFAILTVYGNFVTVCAIVEPCTRYG